MFSWIRSGAVLSLAMATPTLAQTVLHEFHGDQQDAELRRVRGHGDVDADGRDDIALVQKLPAGGHVVQVRSGRDGAVLHAWFPGPPVSAACFAGDVNGDGHADVAIGSREDAGLGAGLVTVHSGRDGSILHRWVGDPWSGLGVDVDGAGDVNGDGFGDVIASADPVTSVPDSFFAVYSGRDGGVLFRHDEESELVNVRVTGLGDVNGDGTPDLGRREQGAEVEIYSGRDFSLLATFASTNGSIVIAEDAGDVDADGFADLVLGHPGAERHGVTMGNAIVYSGRTGADLYTFWGNESGDRLGWDAEGVGDLNQATAT